MNDLVVYGAPLSPFVRKVQAVLEEKSLAYDLEPVNIMPMPDWFKEISPAQRIPVLRDRRVGEEGVPGTIADSSAICAYLEKLEPSPPLYPLDAFDHGRAVWLEEYADSELAGTVGMGIFRPIMFSYFQGKQPDIDAARTTWQDKLPRHFDYLESMLGGNDFFVGDQLSIADIAVGSQLVQLDLIVGPMEGWPGLSKLLAHTRSLSGVQANLESCEKIVGKFMTEKVNLA